MAEVVNPDLDIESDTCTVDDIVMGAQSNDNTRVQERRSKGHQGANSFTNHTKSTSKRATEGGKP